MRVLRTVVAAAASILMFAGCTSLDATTNPDAAPGAGTALPTTSGPVLTGDLTIFAAASLGSAFDEISAAFELEHPALDVLPIRYDGSSTLATQLIEGATADVFASADENNMAKVTDAALAEEPTPFASNTLVIAVPSGNPAGVGGLADLGEAGVTVVLCAPEVPCGAASAALLDNAGVAVAPASFEQNVTAVLTKVAADEADAGLVYATDVVGESTIESIAAEGAASVVNTYPVAALENAPNPEGARAFVAFVVGPKGQRILADHGFGTP